MSPGGWLVALLNLLGMGGSEEPPAVGRAAGTLTLTTIGAGDLTLTTIGAGTLTLTVLPAGTLTLE